MREQRKHSEVRVTREVALKGRRHTNAAPNSLKFLVTVEGVEDFGYIRAANGARWRLA